MSFLKLRHILFDDFTCVCFFFLKNNGDKIVAWELNKNLHNELWNVRLPSVLFLTVPLVDGYNARVKLLIPPTVDIWSNNKKYPLLIFTQV